MCTWPTATAQVLGSTELSVNKERGYPRGLWPLESVPVENYFSIVTKLVAGNFGALFSLSFVFSSPVAWAAAFTLPGRQGRVAVFVIILFCLLAGLGIFV